MSGRVAVHWVDLVFRLDVLRQLPIYDGDGVEWRYQLQQVQDRTVEARLVRADGGDQSWSPSAVDTVWIDAPALPEPPDGTRLEWERDTDVYAAWRDDASSARAGYSTGDGGEVWQLYGASVPCSWTMLWVEHGDALRLAVRLVPHPQDLGNYARWSTRQ